MASISKIARKYYLHASDENHRTGERVAYFCQSGKYGEPEDGWGMWVDRNGNVDVDTETANGDTPSTRILNICRIAAKKLLRA